MRDLFGKEPPKSFSFVELVVIVERFKDETTSIKKIHSTLYNKN